MVEGGGEAFGDEAALAGVVLAEQVAGQMAHHRQVAGGVPSADAAGILAEVLSG